MSMGTCRTKERAPTLAATTGIALGTDAGLQLFTTGKLAAVGELSGVGEGPGLGDELVVEPTAEAVGPGTPLPAGVGERVELLRFELPQATATSRPTTQRAAMAARRLPLIMSSTPPQYP